MHEIEALRDSEKFKGAKRQQVTTNESHYLDQHVVSYKDVFGARYGERSAQGQRTISNASGALPKLRQTANNSFFKRDSSFVDSARRSTYKPLALKDENYSAAQWPRATFDRQTSNCGLASKKELHLKDMILVDSLLFPKRFVQTREFLTPITHDANVSSNQ